jgi:DNA-binding response OmpR family regulator
MKVLIADDDRDLLDLIAFTLSQAGFLPVKATDGTAALELFASEAPDLLVLDINMPGASGFKVCETIRTQSAVPIMMLTARNEEEDLVRSLELGADDYLTKPFNPRELVARIKSILRRSTQTQKSGRPPEAVMEHGVIKIDAGRREVTVSGEQVQLAPKEFDLLWELLDHRGLVLTRDQLLERVWGYTFAGDTRTVDVHVRQLRRKLGDECPVATVWGVGYKVADDAAVT